MLLELGPVNASEATAWTRFARRMVAELRTDPCDLDGVVCEDFLGAWSSLIDRWSADAAGGGTFRWTGTIDDDVAEFLLHGLEHCMASKGLTARISAAELDTHLGFTRNLAQAFIDGLAVEGRPCEHYADRLQALAR